MRFRAQSSTHHLASNHHAERDGYVTITLRVMTIALLTLSTNSITGQATSLADETRTFFQEFPPTHPLPYDRWVNLSGHVAMYDLNETWVAVDPSTANSAALLANMDLWAGANSGQED